MVQLSLNLTLAYSKHVHLTNFAEALTSGSHADFIAHEYARQIDYIATRLIMTSLAKSLPYALRVRARVHDII